MPRSLVQAEGTGIPTGQRLDELDLPKGKVVGASLEADFQLQSAPPNPLDNGELGTVSSDPNQVPDLGRGPPGIADGRGQLSLLDSQTAAGRQSGPV